MGPFTQGPTGIGLIDLVGGLVAAAIVIWSLGYFVVWVFRQGQRSVSEKPKVAEGSDPKNFEQFLACDKCTAETDKLFQRANGPQLCKPCFEKSPIDDNDTNTSSRDNPITKQSGAGGT